MAAGMRGVLGFAAWIFLAGALVMMFLVILSGVVDVTPLNKVYFLQADTSKISGARPVTQWTYFYVCGANNENCSTATPALPFGYAWLGNTDGAPSELVGDYGSGTTNIYYFYMWRFGWVFYLLGLFFGVIAFFTGLLSSVRLGSALSSLMTMIATFWMALAAILMTVEFVKVRDVFRSTGLAADVGVWAFAFTWTSVVCLFIASCLFLGGCLTGRNKTGHTSRRRRRRTRHTRRTSFSRRNRASTRSRGSFIGSES